MKDVSGVKIAILGAGRSGIAAAKMLLKRGAEVVLSDNRKTAELELACSEIEHSNFSYELGGHSGKVTGGVDIMVVSPGIPLNIPVIEKARGLDITVTGELEITSWFCENRIAAVTGTNGKSTTTSMIEQVFNSSGRPAVSAGNIGRAFADVIDELTPDMTVALEVSSYQLETAETFHPWSSVILNIQPDHLERHGTMEEYMRCKMKISAQQTEEDLFILNADDPVLSSVEVSSAAELWQFSSSGPVVNGAGVENDTIHLYRESGRTFIMPCGELPVPGTHNIENALVAVCNAGFAGIPADKIAEGLRNFIGLEHRLEFAAEVKGVRFINDSKATNVDSMMVALQSFSDPVILIAGGKDKGSDLSIANDLLTEKVKRLVLLGEAADRMHNAWGNVIDSINRAPSFEDAVMEAYKSAGPGDTVLLSPACASFDMFDSFEERGRVFKEIVSTLK